MYMSILLVHFHKNENEMILLILIDFQIKSHDVQ